MNNKKIYERASLTVLCFEQTDSITTSGGAIVLPDIEFD